MFGAERRYRRHVRTALNKAFRNAAEASFDAAEEKLIVFSDLHKGSRDGADDFWRCERAYHAALGYYLEQGHTLYALGDVEELWECNPEEVLKAYPATLGLEAEFHQRGRYRRFWGNHDDLWSRPDQVGKHLSPFYGEGLEAHEAIKLRVAVDGEALGTLFLAHGHQGTAFSDRHRTVGRFFVHNFWRRIQRITKRSLNTPATDANLRGRHDTVMYEWARDHGERPVLIAGHTHHPVFWNDWRRKLAEEKAGLEALRSAPLPRPRKLARARARYEHNRAAWRWPGPPPRTLEAPCYFNTGCCAFGDGDVTGIEIADGEIRLVRWLDDSERPRPQILASADLAEVFAKAVEPGAVATVR
jgi:UDP-2,3-diacylglucosamine pyrophosphatase LpxH